MRPFFSSLFLPSVVALVISPAASVSGTIGQPDSQNQLSDKITQRSSPHGFLNSQNIPLHDASKNQHSANQVLSGRDIQDDLVAMCETGFVSSCEEAIEQASKKNQDKDMLPPLPPSHPEAEVEADSSDNEYSSQPPKSQSCDIWIQSYDPPYLSPNAISQICSTGGEEIDFKGTVLECFDHTYDDIVEISEAIDRHCSSMPNIYRTRSCWSKLCDSLHLFFIVLSVFLSLSWLYIRSLRCGDRLDQNVVMESEVYSDDQDILLDETSLPSEVKSLNLQVVSGSRHQD
ncbi:hypothetical protein N7478_000575 [Penicillium angulare]|uniref:uncharacterized protein n=1 Tax=Penicillium angulare TaxID=116970 RepID=UPI002541BBBB|nr:uncharacterized protein N7478_000575 [Penicillium angulare]KAJ5291324.1 hypothetical protein N7478_000575 [Penicillium angulare]